MPISVNELFREVGLTCAGRVCWGEKVPLGCPGVYVVSISSEPTRNSGLLKEAPIDVELIRKWIKRVPTFSFDGESPPDPRKVAALMGQMWLPDENILYIGKATSLLDRLNAYFGHELGDARPHKGGSWLKVLSNLKALYVYFCDQENEAAARQKEAEALGAFVRQVSPSTKKTLYNPQLPIPFANLEFPQGTRKQKRIRGHVLR